MTTSTPSPARRNRRFGAYTLVEVLISAGLAGFILTGILTSFLFLGRSSANIVNYAEMETEARKGLENFAVDTRQANDLVWVNANTITLKYSDGSFTTYGYNVDTKAFYRVPSSKVSGVWVAGSAVTLIRNVDSFEFRGYQINSSSRVDISDLSTASARATASNVTKQIQISMRATRQSMTAVGVTNSVFSARYILRNKKVTV